MEKDTQNQMQTTENGTQNAENEAINAELQARIARFEARKAARIDRLRERADKLRAKHAGNDLSLFGEEKSGIPMGQPILVGHHSERRHRRHLERIERKVRAHYEAEKYAANLESRAEAAESNDVIQSNDPQALQKINDRIKELETTRETYKTINKYIRKGDRDGLTAFLISTGRTPEKAAKYTAELFNPAAFGGQGIPSFTLTNLGANIRRLQQRAAAQVKIEKGFQNFQCGSIIVELIDGQIQVEFKGKPSEETREKLKRSPLALKWSRYSGRWVRKHTETTASRYFIESLKQTLTNCPESAE